MKNTIAFPFLVIALFGLLLGCQETPKGTQTMVAETVVKALQKRLIEAKAGEEIVLPAGTFSFKRSISLNDTPGISIKGAGKGKTILSFKGQIEGAEGMLIKKCKRDYFRRLYYC